jgi:hypothetical protein
MQAGDFHNVFKEYEPGLTGIGTEPTFAIGQRALLLQTDQGNILWDCITYLDNDTIAIIQQRGGLKAITISHSHFYTTLVEWATRGRWQRCLALGSYYSSSRNSRVAPLIKAQTGARVVPVSGSLSLM